LGPPLDGARLRNALRLCNLHSGLCTPTGGPVLNARHTAHLISGPTLAAFPAIVGKWSGMPSVGGSGAVALRHNRLPDSSAVPCLDRTPDSWTIDG
jgi:hypothetical protein